MKPTPPRSRRVAIAVASLVALAGLSVATTTLTSSPVPPGTPSSNIANAPVETPAPGDAAGPTAPDSDGAARPDSSDVGAELLAALDSCGTAGPWLPCAEEAFAGRLDAASTDTVLAELGELRAQGGDVDANCHSLAHAIGQAAFQRAGDLGTILGSNIGMCQYGFTHGAMQAYTNTVDEAQFRADISNACAPLGEPRSPDVLYCAHGMGHAIGARWRFDMQTSDELCTTMRDQDEYENCLAGAIMEYANQFQGSFTDGGSMDEALAARDREISRFGDDPYDQARGVFDRCSELEGYDGLSADICYEQIAALNVNLTGGDFATLSSWCSELAESARRTCNGGLGGPALPWANADVADAVGYCLEADDEYERYCVAHLANNFAINHADLQLGWQVCDEVTGANLVACNAQMEETTSLVSTLSESGDF